MEDNREYGVQPRTDGYYYWAVESKTNQGTAFGNWRLGPQGQGPGTLIINRQDTVSNEISVSYTSAGDIAASLGIGINVAQSYGVQYSVYEPAGSRYQIKYRPLYTQYKVVQRQYYRMDGNSIKTNNTNTSTVKVFYDWGFSYNML